MFLHFPGVEGAITFYLRRVLEVISLICDLNIHGGILLFHHFLLSRRDVHLKNRLREFPAVGGVPKEKYNFSFVYFQTMIYSNKTLNFLLFKQKHEFLLI